MQFFIWFYESTWLKEQHVYACTVFMGVSIKRNWCGTGEIKHPLLSVIFKMHKSDFIFNSKNESPSFYFKIFYYTINFFIFRERWDKTSLWIHEKICTKMKYFRGLHHNGKITDVFQNFNFFLKIFGIIKLLFCTPISQTSECPTFQTSVFSYWFRELLVNLVNEVLKIP